MRDTLAYYLHHPGKFPWSFTLWLVGRQLRRTLGKFALASQASSPNGWLDSRALSQQYAHLARDPSALATHFRTRQQPCFFPGAGSEPIHKRQPPTFKRRWVEETVAQARRICDHIFEYAGFPTATLGPSIDWQKDPMMANLERGKKDGGASTPPGTTCDDVRVVWELNRCHQLVTLGQAYWHTGEEAYVEEVASQMRSWVMANPVGQGVNWSSPMEVAIRIINWIWAFYLVRDSSHLGNEAVHQFMWQVRSHGEHIRHNLERSAVSNNHYLANGVGLLHLGILFPELKESAQWLRIGKRIVFGEVLKQVFADGVDFEGSIPYQGFVLDLLLPTILLCKRNNVPVPLKVLDRVERMLEFVQAYTRPDGTVPQLGDTDDGRLLVLAPRLRNTHSTMLTLGALLFDRSDFKAASCGWGPEAHWLLGEEGFQRFRQLEAVEERVTTSRGFTEGGIYCMRHGDLHMVIDCADVGTRGRGGHGHNDCLSFELFAFGHTFITDSGTFRYAGPEEERNLFRSTAAHNTAVVDGQEMGRFFRGTPWRIHDNARPTLHLWHTDDQVDIFDGSHSGYQRLHEPVRHRRRIIFDKRNQLWVLEDIFTGKGEHTFDLLFHFAPMPVELSGDGQMITLAEDPSGARLALIPMSAWDLEAEVRPGWVSTQYGARKQAPVLRYSLRGSVPMVIRLCLYPMHPGQEYDMTHVRSMALEAVKQWGSTALAGTSTSPG